MSMPPVVILSGGEATRLYPVTKTVSKAMIEISGRPFIAHQLELLKRNQITKVVLCIGNLGEQIKNFVKDGNEFGLEVRYSQEHDQLLGTGGAVKKALPLLDDIFFVMYGDSYLDIEFQPVLDYFLSHQGKGLLTVFKNKNQWQKSNIVFKDAKIIKYDKKEISKDMEYIDFGLSLWRKQVFIDSAYAEVFDLAQLIQDLVSLGELLGYEVDRRFFEIGSFQGIEETRHYLESQTKEKK